MRKPLLVASVGFTFGVLYGPADLPWIDLIAGLLCIAIARRRKFRFPIMHSVFLWAGAFFLGLPVGSFLLPPPATLAPNATQIEGVVIEAPDRGLIADGLLVDVDAPARARVLLRMPHGNRGRHPEPCGAPGDRIRATVQLAPRRASLVPAFRSRRLAVRRGVQLYGEATECSVIAAGIDESFLARAVGTAIRHTEIAHAGILGALATGDRSGAFLRDEEAINDAGLAFLLELSGLAIALPFFLLLFALRKDPKRASLLAVPLLLALVFLYGATPSIIRSALVLACLLLPALSSKIDVIDALALSVILVLAISPASLGDVRFQLAFAGLSAALRLYPAIAERIPGLGSLPKWGRAPIHLLLLAIAIAIGTAPLAARLFDRVSLLSFAAAPLALIAMLGLIAPLSLAGGLLALIAPAAGRPLLCLASLLLDGVFALLPAPVAAIPTPTVLECVLFYGLITAFAAPRSSDPRAKRAKIALAAASAVALIGSFATGLLTRTPELAVLPATRGHTYVLRQPDGTIAVRDSSPPAAWFQMEQRLVSNYLKLRRETKIDVLLVDPNDDRAIREELSHQFPIGRIEPVPAELTIGSNRIVVQDGSVTAGGRTYGTEEHGLIRIREKDGSLEVIPLRVP